MSLPCDELVIAAVKVKMLSILAYSFWSSYASYLVMTRATTSKINPYHLEPCLYAKYFYCFWKQLCNDFKW